MTPPSEDGRKRSPKDYIFGKVLGEGSFSTVYLAKDVHTNKEYAIKVLDKSHIIRERKTEYVMREKEVLRMLGNSCQYFVRLFWTFQDSERLYFVLTYAKNGELLKQIDKHECFNMECTRYYTAELVLALEYLRRKGIVHRDLKPENVLFDENWHILITDFGSAKIMDCEKFEEMKYGAENCENSVKQRRNSFVGSAQFVSPEMLQSSTSSYASDLWALGCIIYQMVSGLMPFRGRSEYLIFQKIITLEYEYPQGFNPVVKDLVDKLLVLIPDKRLGATDEEPYSSIREHKFFEDFDWNNFGIAPKISDICDDMKYIIPDNLEPGLDKEKASRLHLDLFDPVPSPTRKKSQTGRNITDLSSAEIDQRLEVQKNNPYNGFVENNLILKQGLIDKKKGLFARRRMFLLTLGPHLYYVDPVTMVLKGEIPWSDDMRTEAKNFKVFFVYTVRSAQFVSPEMLQSSTSSYASDLWALGCIIYQMVSGLMPFRGRSEYLIFQKIITLEYEYPQGFNPVVKDLVDKLLVLIPDKRLGATDEEPYSSIREHKFFEDFDWNNFGIAPKISDICDDMKYIIPDNLEPGLDKEKASRLHLDLFDPVPSPTRKKSQTGRNITDLSSAEIDQRLEVQKNNPYNGFVENNLILKQGLIDKKKGLFARRRMFLLTLGPHLYYVDPVTMVLKGEIPWSDDMRTEAKNFKVFFVYTPNRKYYLEDPEGYALEWCKAIDEVKAFYYPEQT